jgi:hypothetical protein
MDYIRSGIYGDGIKFEHEGFSIIVRYINDRYVDDITIFKKGKGIMTYSCRKIIPSIPLEDLINKIKFALSEAGDNLSLSTFTEALYRSKTKGAHKSILNGSISA